jgi:hypothetical protein
VKTAYVTQSSYKRLARFLMPSENISIDKIFEMLFEQSLRAIINDSEARALHTKMLMVGQQFEDLKMHRRDFSSQYVFSVGKPKYHKAPDCKYLKSDFKNYLVPPQITELGPDKVREFQEFCEANKKVLESKSDDAFWAIVGMKFKVHVAPTPVTYSNSGVQDISQMSVEELRALILAMIEEAHRMLRDLEFGEFLRRIRFARHSKQAFSNVESESLLKAAKAFFDLKWKIIHSLFELYVKQSGLTDFAVPVPLLDAAEFEPCRGCHRSAGSS